MPPRPSLRRAWLVVAASWLAFAALAGVAGSAPSAAERISTLEAQIADKKRAIERMEQRNVELSRSMTENPGEAGANFSTRQEIRSNARYITGYRAELGELERALAKARATSVEGPTSSAPPRSAPAEPRAAEQRPAAPRATAARPAEPASATPREPVLAHDPAPAVSGDPSALDTSQVHELMRSWALGRGGVPGVAADGSLRTPLAILVAALDWRLDWRELSLGLMAGAALGGSLPIALIAVLRRRRPARVPVVGSVNRKWASLAGATGKPSKQWSDLSAKARPSTQLAAGASGVIAAACVAQALASRFGSGLGTPGVWGEVVLTVAGIALGVAGVGLWRNQTLAIALCTACALLVAAVVPISLVVTPFGGAGALAWALALIVAAAAQGRALASLWTLATPRAALQASRQAALVSAATGGVAGLTGAALFLFSV